MKKIAIFLFLLVFVSISGAQTVSGYFTESTQGFTNAFSQKGYIYGKTAILAAGDSIKAIASKPFGISASSMRNSFMNSKILVGIQIDTAFSDVVATLVSQISFDGTNWYTLETLDADTTPNVTGVQMYLATFTDIYAPYARLLFNASTLQIDTAGYIKFLYAIPAL